jgi:antitoxin YobK
MAEYDLLASAAERAGNEVYWLGAASPDQIGTLERTLGVVLPDSFKRFLAAYGGGGIVSAEVSGIEANDASIDSGGTVLGDTEKCRGRYALPNYLVAIYLHDDEVCWCLDTSKLVNNECPVVSYNVFTKQVDRGIAGSFDLLMREHLGLYSKPV